MALWPLLPSHTLRPLGCTLLSWDSQPWLGRWGAVKFHKSSTLNSTKKHEGWELWLTGASCQRSLTQIMSKSTLSFIWNMPRLLSLTQTELRLKFLKSQLLQDIWELPKEEMQISSPPNPMISNNYGTRSIKKFLCAIKFRTDHVGEFPEECCTWVESHPSPGQATLNSFQNLPHGMAGSQPLTDKTSILPSRTP